MDAFYIEFRAIKPFHQLYTESCKMGKAAEFRRQHLATRIKKSYNHCVDLEPKESGLNHNYALLCVSFFVFSIFLLFTDRNLLSILANLLFFLNIGVKLGFVDRRSFFLIPRIFLITYCTLKCCGSI